MMQATAHTPVPLPVASERPELEARGQCDNASSRSGQQLGPRARWRGASLAVRASACVESMAANLERGSQSLKGDLLGLVHGGSFDRLELGHELGFERVVLGPGPSAMLIERLGNGDLKVHTAAAHLPGDLGRRQRLDFGQVLGETEAATTREVSSVQTVSRSAGPTGGLVSMR